MNNRNTYHIAFIVWVLSACLFNAAAADTWKTPQTLALKGTVTIAFSPNGGVQETIVRTINAAQKTILVQAYSFTSYPIYSALVAANQRGVLVQVLLDPITRNKDARGSGARFLLSKGIAVWIDAPSHQGLAHNKVMIIDGKTVITGSFNFSRQGEVKNTENILVLQDMPQLAQIYTEYWQDRRKKAQSY